MTLNRCYRCSRPIVIGVLCDGCEYLIGRAVQGVVPEDGVEMSGFKKSTLKRLFVGFRGAVCTCCVFFIKLLKGRNHHK